MTDEAEVEAASLTATVGTGANAGVTLTSGFGGELLVLQNIAEKN